MLAGVFRRARRLVGRESELFPSEHLRGAVACHSSRMALSRAATIAKYGRGEAIFTQGDACSDVLCIRTGGVKLTVLSKTSYEMTVAMLVQATFSRGMSGGPGEPDGQRDGDHPKRDRDHRQGKDDASAALAACNV